MSAAESTVRDDIESAIKELETPEAPVVETPDKPVVEAASEVESEQQKQERARDEKGRFVARSGELDQSGKAAAPGSGDGASEGPAKGAEVSATPVIESAPKQEAPVALAPPNGWSAEAKAKWHELPAEIMAAVQKREQDVAKFTSTRDEHASFGKEVYQTVQPYLAQIQAEGGTPASAIRSLLNTAYVLRTGSAEQKRHLLAQVAQQYGVDLGQPTADPNAQHSAVSIQAEIDRAFREREAAQKQQEAQRIQAEVQTEIEAFAADSKHPHYEAVKGHMAALIAQGLAKDLQDAYEQAVWAKPDVRATLEAQKRAEEEQKRKSEAAEKAALARKKAVSVTGGPGNTASSTAPGSKGSVRDDLLDAFATHSGGV